MANRQAAGGSIGDVISPFKMILSRRLRREGIGIADSRALSLIHILIYSTIFCPFPQSRLSSRPPLSPSVPRLPFHGLHGFSLRLNSPFPPAPSPLLCFDSPFSRTPSPPSLCQSLPRTVPFPSTDCPMFLSSAQFQDLKNKFQKTGNYDKPHVI